MLSAALDSFGSRFRLAWQLQTMRDHIEYLIDGFNAASYHGVGPLLTLRAVWQIQGRPEPQKPQLLVCFDERSKRIFIVAVEESSFSNGFAAAPLKDMNHRRHTSSI